MVSCSFYKRLNLGAGWYGTSLVFLECILQLDSISIFFWMWPKNKRRDQRKPKEPDMVAESEGSQV